MKIKQKTKAREKLKSNLKEEKGITLIALVITIVILIILATITINLAFGENGLIQRAQDARDLHEQGASEEEELLNSVDEYLAGKLEGIIEDETEVKTIKEAKEAGTVFTSKKELEDEVGNIVTIPAGFKVATDSDDTVQGGVVIEDVSASNDANVQGSQYVWIPVEEFIKDDGSRVNIVLGRYTFLSGIPNLRQAAYTDDAPENYTQSIAIATMTELTTYREGQGGFALDDLNATAYNLEAWVNSARDNGGYYIGRYEASYASGVESEDSINYANCKAASKISTSYTELTYDDETGEQTNSMNYIPGELWNDIDQTEASIVAINTYSDSSNVRSDLMNSYAWDTALVFIQEAADEDYSLQGSVNSSLGNTGNLGNGLIDEVCKINNMASNLIEFTTEYSSHTQSGYAMPCTVRGGWYESSGFPANARANNTVAGAGQGFRLCLYLQ